MIRMQQITKLIAEQASALVCAEYHKGSECPSVWKVPYQWEGVITTLKGIAKLLLGDQASGLMPLAKSY